MATTMADAEAHRPARAAPSGAHRPAKAPASLTAPVRAALIADRLRHIRSVARCAALDNRRRRAAAGADRRSSHALAMRRALSPQLEHRHLAADIRCMFRTHILPAIIALWGAAIVLNTLLNGPDGSGAYATGQLAAGAFGVVMIVLGTRSLLKARRASSNA